jgi:hypothetical protein
MSLQTWWQYEKLVARRVWRETWTSVRRAWGLSWVLAWTVGTFLWNWRQWNWAFAVSGLFDAALGGLIIGSFAVLLIALVKAVPAPYWLYTHEVSRLQSRLDAVESVIAERDAKLNVRFEMLDGTLVDWSSPGLVDGWRLGIQAAFDISRS